MTYHNEIELTELRLKMLNDAVDLFVIVEADRTHSGVPKDFVLKKQLQERGLLNDKVIVHEITLPSLMEQKDHWVRENAQRDASALYLTTGDVVFVTDADEIPNPDFIQYYAQKANEYTDAIIRIPMAFLNCRADLQVVDFNGLPRQWSAAYVCLEAHTRVRRLSQIRESFTRGATHWDLPGIFLTDGGQVLNAGWHFSWMGGNINRLRKWISYAESGNRVPGAVERVADHIAKYETLVHAVDPLGREDHILSFYHWNDLPKKIFELPNVKEFLLPGTKIDHFYFRPEMGESWFTFPNLYRSMVERFPSGSLFVEVGVWKGRSASFMATEIVNAGKQIDFVCIDHWEGSSEHQEVNKHELKSLYEIYSKNMEPVKGHYRDMKMPSLEAVKSFKDGSIDFCFIDASHEYELFKGDFVAWLPKIKKGGVLAGHDCYPNNPEFGGVYRALMELIPGKFTVSENCWIYEVQ